MEAIRGYVATDYDYPSNLQAVRDDLEGATREVMEGIEGEPRERLQAALDMSLGMNPLTPDHHFYVDQGTNARLRVAAIAIGRKLVEAGAPRRSRGRRLPALQRAAPADGRPRGVRRPGPGRPIGATIARTRTRSGRRRGSAPRRSPRSTFPYAGLWGFPERFHAGEPSTTGELKGLAASPGVVEGPARFVSSLEEFDQVQEGEILVCRMTNPAWVVLFTKIAGLVTEAGGTVSHPAVVAREFGIPAVVGTGNAGERIRTGDRIRVNGATGVVDILGVTAAAEPRWLQPARSTRRSRCDASTATTRWWWPAGPSSASCCRPAS